MSLVGQDPGWTPLSDLEMAARHLREAEVLLAKASTILGRSDRKDWWYDCNKAWHLATDLAEKLEAKS